MRPEPVPHLAEILARPGDDAPRLAAARAYEERGELERAELLRVSCRERALPASSREGRALARRRRELIAAHGERWCGDLPPGIDRLHFEHGLPQRAFLFLDEVDEATAAGLAPFPILELAGDGEPDPDRLRAFLARPELRHVRRLSFPLSTHDEGVLEAAADTGLLARLESIELGDGTCPATLELLERADPPDLRELVVHGYLCGDFGDAGARHLAASPLLARLERLRLHDVALTPEGVAALASSPSAGGLRELSFSGGSYGANQVGPEGARALAQSPHLGRLEVLGLGHGRIGDAGVQALARTRHMGALRELHLSSCELSHDGFKHLAVSELIDRLVHLDLARNPLEARALHPLLVSVPPALRELRLADAPLGDEGLRHLARSRLGDELLLLDLVRTGMGEEGALELASTSSLGRLETLRIGGDVVGDRGLAALGARFGEVLDVLGAR